MVRKDEKKLIIKIPKKLHEIEEIAYDENADNFLISIVSKKNKIKSSDLIFDTLTPIIHAEKNMSFAQLLGRALSRTRESKLFLSSWSFVSPEDIRKTKSESSSASFFQRILEEIIRNAPPQPLSIILWQDKKGVWAIIKPNSRKDIFEKMKKSSDFLYKDDYLLAGPYANFSEAEIKIRKVIKEIIQ